MVGPKLLLSLTPLDFGSNYRPIIPPIQPVETLGVRAVRVIRHLSWFNKFCFSASRNVGFRSVRTWALISSLSRFYLHELQFSRRISADNRRSFCPPTSERYRPKTPTAPGLCLKSGLPMTHQRSSLQHGGISNGPLHSNPKDGLKTVPSVPVFHRSRHVPWIKNWRLKISIQSIQHSSSSTG